MILISGRQDMDKIPRRRRWPAAGGVGGRGWAAATLAGLTAGVLGSRGFAAATLAGLIAVSELAMSAPPATAQWWRQ